ncbi:MAG: hypothetical protein R6V49_03440 [Bacteroidales bacterium]
MKKLFLALAISAILAACGGNAEQAEEPVVSPEVIELEQTTKSTSDEAEALEAEADSLLNNL